MNVIARQRVDKWLWQARFFKTRTRASKAVSNGKVRLNTRKILKPASLTCVGDVLTFTTKTQILVVRVIGLSTRRMSPNAATMLYECLSRESVQDNRSFKYVDDSRARKKLRQVIDKLG